MNSIRDLLTSFDTDGGRRDNNTSGTSREGVVNHDGGAEDSETSDLENHTF